MKILDKTVIVLSSDNGFFFGEHGLTTERRLPYEESIRDPLLMRYPPRIAAGARPDGLALTVDLAPTLLEFAGVPISSGIQGRSLIPLLSTWTTARCARPATSTSIWIKFPEQDERYDLKSDSLERHNVAQDPAMSAVRSQLRAELGRLVVEAMGLKSP